MDPETADRLKQVAAAVEQGKLSSGAGENLKRWLTQPQYQKYGAQLAQLIDDGAFNRLETMFWEVIPFGTGGRRGVMGQFGSATINERTIAESAHGLAVYLQRQKPGGGGKGVVTSDTRNRSDEFARLTACTLAANGLMVYLFDAPRSTPELSFAVRHLTCDVGVMISASHNPPSDNGFKAYWSSGAQVLPPHDQGIIDAVYQSGDIPTLDFDQAVSQGKIQLVGQAVDRAYWDAVLAMSLSQQRAMPALFSPLHGVGESSVYAVLQRAGFDGLDIYEPHRRLDGNFPNVADHFPNPERSAVFAPLIEHAQKTGKELILASDPDADRLGAAIRENDGRFVHLTGNRIGALLADYILRKRVEAGTLSTDHFVVETLVTTPLIAALARAHNVRAVDDLLVGFKYIAETMDRLGPDKFVFGAEESLGYLAGTYARDKDASIAALYLMELAAELRGQGKTLLDRLDELYIEHGYFTEGQRSEECKGAQGQQQIAQLMDEFRQRPPAAFAGFALDRVRDYGRHEIRSLPANTKTSDLPQPSGNLLFLESLRGDFRFSIAVRPSGTEPKIKFYFFAQAPCSEPAKLPALKENTEASLKSVQDALSDWVRKVLGSKSE